MRFCLWWQGTKLVFRGDSLNFAEELRMAKGSKRRAAATEDRQALRHRKPGRTKRIKQDSESNAEKYALLACGSFNPITNMHLRMFEIAKDYLWKKFEGCEVSRGILSPVSDGYGKRGLQCSKHRLKMCQLCVKSNPWLEVSEWECDRETWTPTVEVLQNTKDHLTAQGDVSKLMLLCGSDFLESFNIPGLWTECDIKKILQDFGMVVIQRPGFDSDEVLASNKILCDMKSNIHVVSDLVSNNTSSTLIRQAIREKHSIKYLTPDPVVKYIAKHELYATEESESKNSGKALAPFSVNATAV